MTSSSSIDPSFCSEAFSLAPDPQRLFLSRDHAEALAALRLGLDYRRGLIVVVGEVGMGKTTVAYSLLATFADEVHTAYVANTRLPFDGLLRHTLEDFGVECREHDRASLLTALNTFLLECARVGQMAVLVVDEAQSLDDETFENLRLLSNVETYNQKLLQIVLLGQPELDTKLRKPHLRQISDRVAVRVNINPLDRGESRAYVEHRLERAGGSLRMFSRPALRLIVKQARGVPRRMNILCHNALLLAYAAGSEQVTWSMAREAVREQKGGNLVLLPRRVSAATVPRAEVRNSVRWWTATGTALVLSGLVLSLGLSYWAATSGTSTASSLVLPEPARLAVPVREEPARAAVETEAPAADPAGFLQRASSPESTASAPEALHITVDHGATLLHIVRRFYGQDSPELIQQIMQANPALRDPDMIVAGSRLILPGATTRGPMTKGGSQS
jgi:type II secretory pathway predicted ATPase ExeA